MKFNFIYRDGKINGAIVDAGTQTEAEKLFADKLGTVDILNIREARKEDIKPGKLTISASGTKNKKSGTAAKASEGLTALYRSELAKAWNDEKMIDFCAKNTAVVIEHNGRLYNIDKPKIKTRFCFGAGMYATATNEEISEAEEEAQNARTNANYFISENLAEINRTIESLNDILSNIRLKWSEGSYPHYMIKTGNHYYSQSEDCILSGWQIVNTYSIPDLNGLCWDCEFIDKLIAGYEQVKQEFIKRLNAYLKRYGLSKIDSWSYIRD